MQTYLFVFWFSCSRANMDYIFVCTWDVTAWQRCFNHYFLAVQSWETESDRVRQKLLSLIGRIGREARVETTTGKASGWFFLWIFDFLNVELLVSVLPRSWLSLPFFLQVLEVLWELAHLPTLPCSLIQQALEEHLTILSDAYAVKEAIKRSYIIKCIEDIKRVGSLFYLFQSEILSSLDVALFLQDAQIVCPICKFLPWGVHERGRLCVSHFVDHETHSKSLAFVLSKFSAQGVISLWETTRMGPRLEFANGTTVKVCQYFNCPFHVKA